MYYPILFHIGKINFYTHGLMMVLGAALGGVILYNLAKRDNKRTDFIFDLVIYVILGGLVGARILYLILYYNQFAGFREMLMIWYGGLVSYGGLIGGFTVAYFVIRAKKENILGWFDIGSIGLFAGWAIGRIGCFLTNDSLGVASNSILAIGGRLPVTLFESVWSLVVAVAGYLLWRIRDKVRLPEGAIFLVTIGLYALGRFVIDFFRQEDVFFLGLKAGQVGSLAVFIIAVGILAVLWKKRRLKWF